eukprot:379610-Pleurochrysis_carterae.AAC.1
MVQIKLEIYTNCLRLLTGAPIWVAVGNHLAGQNVREDVRARRVKGAARVHQVLPHLGAYSARLQDT